MLTNVTIVYASLLLLAAFAAVAKKLTIPGAVTGFVVAIFVFKGGQIVALTELAAFFAAGTLASMIGLTKKKNLGIAEENKGRRTMWQVLANGGVAALLGALSFIFPSARIYFPLMMAGSLAAATADTLSSELGNVYGKRFYNITTLKKDIRGRDGVISLEGTLAGVFGAAIIATIYFLGTGNILSATFVLFSGIFGTLIDSVLGATLERRELVTNNQVNFLNTLAGALTAAALWLIFK